MPQALNLHFDLEDESSSAVSRNLYGRKIRNSEPHPLKLQSLNSESSHSPKRRCDVRIGLAGIRICNLALARVAYTSKTPPKHNQKVYAAVT